MPRIHQHGDDAILIFDDPAERIQLPEEGANVICRFGNGFGAFWMDGAETVPIAGATPHASVEDALAGVIASLDAYAERRLRHNEEDAQRALLESAVPRPEDSLFWNAGRVGLSMPAATVLRLLNALPPGTPVREEAIVALRDFKDPWHGGNGSILHGIVRAPDGELKLDVQRYTVAVQRKKQASYAATVMEKLRKVAKDIATVNDFLNEEARASSVPGIAVAGEALVDMPARPLEALEAVNALLKPALADASSVHQRITDERAAAQLSGFSPPDAEANNDR